MTDAAVRLWARAVAEVSDVRVGTLGHAVCCVCDGRACIARVRASNPHRSIMILPPSSRQAPLGSGIILDQRMINELSLFNIQRGACATRCNPCTLRMNTLIVFVIFNQ